MRTPAQKAQIRRGLATVRSMTERAYLRWVLRLMRMPGYERGE